MKKLIRADLVKELQKKMFTSGSGEIRTDDVLLSLEEKHLNLLIKYFTEQICEFLVAGNTLELRNFGVFELHLRKAKKKARNPKTGKAVNVPQHSVVYFRAGKHLKEAVRNVDSSA